MKEKLIASIMVIIAFGSVILLLDSQKAEAEQLTTNTVIKGCLALQGYTPDKFDNFNFNKASACFHNWKAEQNKQELAELRDFLKHNPRYRYPGQSNNKCFGKEREMPFKTAYIERSGDGFKAGVTYKDKMPANCFESAPWDNRNVEN